MAESTIAVSRENPALHRFLEATARSASTDPLVRYELEEIRGLCSRSVRVTRSQIVPENALLADALSPDRTGPAFLEVLPIAACNHGCTWCFTAARLSSEISADPSFAAQLREFALRGGLATLFSGGGEPLIYRPLSVREEQFENQTVCRWLIRHGVAPAIITNGTLLRRFVEANCDWLQQTAFVRVSLDACTAQEHASRHRTSSAEFDEILGAMKLLLDIRGPSVTPAVGISFVVDSQSGINANDGALRDIEKLASSLGVDFVQLKHLHTSHLLQADRHMRWLAEQVDAFGCPSQFEWWIHRYRAAEPGDVCYVPVEAQVLRSNGQRGPCCHLQALPLPRAGQFTVSGCTSLACRYQSMNEVLRRIRQSPERRYLEALRRLKTSLVSHGFHPFRLFPSAPDLATKAST